VGAGLTELTDEIKETLAITKEVTGKLSTLSDEISTFLKDLAASFAEDH